jgi:hypothetical protein
MDVSSEWFGLRISTRQRDISQHELPTQRVSTLLSDRTTTSSFGPNLANWCCAAIINARHPVKTIPMKGPMPRLPCDVQIWPLRWRAFPARYVAPRSGCGRPRELCSLVRTGIASSRKKTVWSLNLEEPQCASTAYIQVNCDQDHPFIQDLSFQAFELGGTGLLYEMLPELLHHPATHRVTDHLLLCRRLDFLQQECDLSLASDHSDVGGTNPRKNFLKRFQSL